MILRQLPPKSPESSGYEAQLLSPLHGLGAPAGAELVEHPARVRLDRVLADVDALSDLPVAQALRNQLQDLELARGDAEGFDLGLIAHEFERCRHQNFADHHRFDASGELEAEPDSERGEYGGDQTAVDLYRVFQHQPAVLDQLETNDEDAGEKSVTQDVFA